MPPVIYAYHAPVMEIDQREAFKQINLWKKSWTKFGWDPKVLNLTHASLHPKFRDWTAKLMRRPTCNPRAYEIACFHRWMAVAALGGGWMSDYDVINLGFKPIEPVGIGHAVCCPCLVSGSKDFFERIVEQMTTMQDVVERGVPHFSDQVAFEQLEHADLVQVREDVEEFRYGQPYRLSLVHIKTDHAVAAGMPKHVLMEHLLKTVGIE